MRKIFGEDKLIGIPKRTEKTKTTKTSFVQVKTIVYDVVSVFFSLWASSQIKVFIHIISSLSGFQPVQKKNQEHYVGTYWLFVVNFLGFSLSAASRRLFWDVGQGLSSLFEQNLKGRLEWGSQSQQHRARFCRFSSRHEILLVSLRVRSIRSICPEGAMLKRNLCYRCYPCER